MTINVKILTENIKFMPLTGGIFWGIININLKRR